ncbi:MAG: efflux RND transporter periplasmic adaptor subunit [Sulfurimonas sp.]|nr:efflux RND transporter periplasmic adaptor subunit [Sulfurimonas sp.]
MSKIFNKKVLALVLSLVLVVVAARFLLAQKAKVAQALPAEQTEISLRLEQSSQGALSQTQSYLATVEADKSITLSSKLSGYVEEVLVKEAAHVQKGALLVRIDAVQSRADIDAAKSAMSALENELAYKRSVWERNKKLYEIKGLSKEQLDQSAVALSASKSLVEAKRLQITSLQHQLDYLNIRAPFEATIAKLYVHEGDLAAPAKALVQLSSMEKKLSFSFTGSHIAVGMHVWMDKEDIGAIDAIYDDAKNGLKVAQIALSQEIPYKNGEDISIEIVLQSVAGCTLDARAILYDDFGTKVVAYKENSFHFVDVKVLLQGNERVIVSPCVQEKVALASQSKLALLPQYEKIHIIEASDEPLK